MEEKKKRGPKKPREIDLENPSKRNIAQMFLCENPDITLEELRVKMKRLGHGDMTSLKMVHSYCVSTIKVAQALGHWKEKKKD